jgi:acyl carrier protein
MEESMEAAKVDPQLFLEKFLAQFEGLSPDANGLDSPFRMLPDWSSMQALIVIASLDWDYGVTLSAEELKSATTIGDLHQLVLSKKNAPDGPAQDQ